MRSMPEKKLSKCDRSDRVCFVIETRRDNDVTDHIGLVYTKTEVELSRPIWLGAIYDENHTGQ